MDEPRCAGSKPVAVDLEEGKKYAWCTCGLSESQPFCDGNHNQEGCEFRPVVFTAERSETAYMCQCKKTANGPRCDGSHHLIESGEDGQGPTIQD